MNKPLAPAKPRMPVKPPVPAKPPSPTSFIILIGGPGTFESCDRAHDQTWKNYIVPIQVATQKGQIVAAKNEVLRWWVYAPAYTERWTDDTTDVTNSKLDRGRELIEQRQRDIANVKKSGASDYLDRISRMAKACGAEFKALQKVDDLWTALAALPDHSVSRFWYIGHASATGLMLKLIHTDSCGPAANASDMVSIDDLSARSGLISSKLSAGGSEAKFYGCYTKALAEQWHTRFGSTTEGSTTRIDFGKIDSPSPILEVLPRLQDGTGWQIFSGAPAP